MNDFDSVINKAYQQIAKDRFTPKIACQKCYGFGKVARYPAFNSNMTPDVEKVICIACHGTGRVAAW